MSTDFNWLKLMGTSPVFIVLVACSVLALGAAIERFLYFAKRRGDPDATVRKALSELESGNVREAARICQATQHPFGAAAAALFRDGPAADNVLEERVYIALSEQRMMLERNVGVLGTMAAISPLIGLLGTVWGIMHAFKDMALAGSAGPSVVAAGIAEALFTTAAGIIIAVPSLVTYNHLVRRMNTMLTVAENHTRRIRAALAGMSARPSSAPAPARAPETRPTATTPARTPGHAVGR
ncbi:MAG: MotA/TolQ/ExbB proton channel family protein [Candidatus Eiseniibacteriota bacterium]